MSGDSSGEKTEQPSPQRLIEARKKGQVGKSNELAASLSFLAGILCVMSMIGFSTRKIADLFLAVERSFESLSTVTLAALTLEALSLFAQLAFVPTFFAAAVYTGALWLQVGPVFSVDPIMPKMENLNPASGLKKLFSMKSTVTFSLMVLKSAIVAGAIWIVCRKILPDAVRVIYADTGAALVVVKTGLTHMLLWCGGAFVALGIADLGYHRWQFIKDNRMTMQEVRREHKQDEGDPHLKAERKRTAREDGPLEQLRYMHLASLVVKNSEGKLVVYVYRPQMFKTPLFLLRSAGGQTSVTVLAEAKKHGVPVVLDERLIKTHFPIGSPGSELPEVHSKPVLRHLGVDLG